METATAPPRRVVLSPKEARERRQSRQNRRRRAQRQKMLEEAKLSASREDPQVTIANLRRDIAAVTFRTECLLHRASSRARCSALRLKWAFRLLHQSSSRERRLRLSLRKAQMLLFPEDPCLIPLHQAPAWTPGPSPLLAPPTSAGPCRLNSRRAQPIADRRSALSPELRWPLDWVPAKLSPPVDLDPPPPPSSSPRRCSNAAGTGAASKPPSASQSPPDGRCLSRGSPSEHHPVLLPSTMPRHCALSSRQNLCSLIPGANNSSWTLASFLCICRR